MNIQLVGAILDTHSRLRDAVRKAAQQKILMRMTETEGRVFAMYGYLQSFWVEDDKIVVTFYYNGNYRGEEEVELEADDIKDF